MSYGKLIAIVAAATAATLILLLIGYQLALSGRPPIDPVSSSEGRRFDQFITTDISNTYRVGGETLFTFRAEKVIHRKRKLGPLTINPAKEIRMQNVEIEIHVSATAGRDGGEGEIPAAAGDSGNTDIARLSLQQVLKHTFSAKELGFITRVVIQGITVKVFQKKEEQLALAAGEVTVSLRSPNARYMNGFTLISKDGARVSTGEAEWQGQTRRFFVPGDYVFEDGSEVQRGREAFFAVSPESRITLERN